MQQQRLQQQALQQAQLVAQHQNGGQPGQPASSFPFRCVSLLSLPSFLFSPTAFGTLNPSRWASLQLKAAPGFL